MECNAGFMKSALHDLQAGNTSLDSITQLLHTCPAICDRVYGGADFDLAGPGVYLAHIIQGIIVLLFGTLLSFVSYVVSPHATSVTKLTIARLKVVFDTIYSTGLLIYIAILVTSFVRRWQGLADTALEQSFVQDLLSFQRAVAFLGLCSYLVYRQPAQIKPHAIRWGSDRAWAIASTFSIIGDWVSSMKGRMPTDDMIKLCRIAAFNSGHAESSPELTTPIRRSFMIWIFLIGVVVTVAIIVVNEYVRSTIWTWIKKIFTSYITVVIGIIMWTMFNVVALVFYGAHIRYMRQAIATKADDAFAEWDLAQIMILTAWIPAAYQMVLTALMCLKSHFYAPPEKGGVVVALLLVLLSLMCKRNISLYN